MEERRKFVYPKIGMGTGKTPTKFIWHYIGYRGIGRCTYPKREPKRLLINFRSIMQWIRGIKAYFCHTK